MPLSNRTRIRIQLEKNRRGEYKKKMKTSQELAVDLQQRYDSNIYVPKQQQYKMKKSGDIFNDFANFTDLQGGGKSCDLNDNIYKQYGQAAFPPEPDINNVFYHTVRDVTWILYKSVIGGTPQEFYNLSNYQRGKVVKHMMGNAMITKSDIVNAVLAFAVWGTGNCNSELVYYHSWYNSDIKEDAINLDNKTMLDRLVDIRYYFLSNLKDAKLNPGWVASLLNFWYLLKQYC